MRVLLIVSLMTLGVGCGKAVAESACGPSTCVSGCCDTEGRCAVSSAGGSCGTGGLQCAVCSASQECKANVCSTIAPVDSGVGADAGMALDAGTMPSQPIVAPAEAWTWVDFPDSRCGNGEPTGIGINPTTRSTDLFIYMQGGGACWEGLTCFVVKSAANFETGYTGVTFTSTGAKNLPAFNRAVANNPFKDASFVFVPYCTGDVHAGDAEQFFSNRTVSFKGAKNMQAYLKRLTLTFPSVTRVFLTGSSAGAFGAQLNYPRVREAFPQAEVHVLADSGQMLSPKGTLLTDWVAAWNVTVPDTCVGCLADFTKYPAWLATTYPSSRFALLAYSEDNVLRQFFQYTVAEFNTRTDALLTEKYDPRANARYYYLLGSDHTMMGAQFIVTSPPPASVKLNDFITQWYTGSASWVNVK